MKKKLKECEHKLELAWQEIKGKTYKKSRNGYFCKKCKANFIIDL